MRTYLRLLRFAVPYRWHFVAALVCMIVLAAATSAYVNLLGPALDFLFTGRTSAAGVLADLLPAGLQLAARLEALDRRQILSYLPFVVVGLAIVKGLAYFGQFFLMGVISQRIVGDLRNALFAKLVRLPPAFHVHRHSGDLLSRLSTDVQMVQLAVTDAITTYLRDGITIVVMLVNCFILDWKLSLMVFGAVPLTLVPVVRIAKRLRRNTGDSMASLGFISELALEALAGLRVVQAFGMERWEIARFERAISGLMRSERRVTALRAFSSPLMEVMAAGGMAAAIWWVGGQILDGHMEPGKFFSFVAAVMLLYQPVKQLGRVGQLAMIGAASGQRVFEILDAESVVKDSGSRTLPAFRREIRFEDVWFSYVIEKPVLQGLDLTIGKGEVVAIVGASGSGKTTLANLLPRFWEPSIGRITIDGIDLRELTLSSLREQLSIVTQDTVLFNDTVWANIAYGRPDVAREDVERAARVADAARFIEQLPQGYDTRIGERGVLLSGGQRQRLAVARAVLKNAPILILDEATSALDAESEREVQRALERLMGLDGAQHRTTLVIAHRLSTIRNADRILVLVAGKIVETGRHEELLARDGEYARLWRIFEGEGRERGAAA